MAEPIININMDRNESVTLNIARFVMMMAVLFLHSYTSVQMYQDVISLPVYSIVKWKIFYPEGLPVINICRSVFTNKKKKGEGDEGRNFEKVCRGFW